MTDLERARTIVGDFCGYDPGARWQGLVEGIARALGESRAEIVALRKLTDGDWVWQQINSTRAEARREGAAEMRERAAQVVEPFGCAHFVRALSLTREEPPP